MAATSTCSHFSSAGMTFACAKLDVLRIPHLTLFIQFYLSFMGDRGTERFNLSVPLSLCPSVFSRKRLPFSLPIEILRPGEVLLVIINGRLVIGVARIVILAAEFARISDRFEHREDAETAL